MPPAKTKLKKIRYPSSDLNNEFYEDEQVSPSSRPVYDEKLPLEPILSAIEQASLLPDCSSYKFQGKLTEFCEQNNSPHLPHVMSHKPQKIHPPKLSNPASVKRNICCNCKKSQCLKLYCECFANKVFCQGCNCVNCLNTEENKAERDKAMKSTLERNPIAFDPKIAKERDPEIQETLPRHTRGCHCKKSGCQKKYCECYQSGARCTALCKCEQCKNMEPVEPLLVADAVEPERPVIASVPMESHSVPVAAADLKIEAEPEPMDRKLEKTPLREPVAVAEPVPETAEKKTPMVAGGKRKKVDKSGEKEMGPRRIMERVRQISKKGLAMIQQASGKKERMKLAALMTRSGKKVIANN